MKRLKIIFCRLLNRYVNWSCNINSKLIAIQCDILGELKNEFGQSN